MHPEDPAARDTDPTGPPPAVTPITRVAWPASAPLGPPEGSTPPPPPAPLPARAAPTPAPRRLPTSTIVLAVLLVATLVASGLLLARMLSTNEAWQASAQQWETLARSTGADLATSQSDLDATTTELAATTDQLATAQQRITELADEKAQLGDTSASQQQLADYQARVSQAAGQVATALASCVDGQQRLIGYLQDSAQYDPADLARFTTDVQTVCARATDANAALQRELDR